MGICCSSSSSSNASIASQPTQGSKPNINKNTDDDHHLVPAHHTDKFGHEVDNNTGGRVFSEAYYEARKEASEQARLRGEFFEKSKHAYNNNHKADAKHLSDEGNQLHPSLYRERRINDTNILIYYTEL